MSISADTIVANIVAQLKILDPTVSAEVGTPERKIIEATAEIIASQQVDFSVLNSQTDISTLSGGRLDAYLSIFNFGRQAATPAYGTVTFTRNQTATQQIVIPRGTQVQAVLNNTTFPTLIFVTTDSVVLDPGATNVSVTAQCTVAGTIGNIDANTISGFGGLQNIAGISSVSNAQAFSGGIDAESDTAYVARFQNSFMRNISGTTDMFLALAVSMNGVTKANVVGAISRFQEYLLIPTSDDVGQKTQSGDNYDPLGTTWPHKRTSAKSINPYTQFTYPANFYVTDGNLDPSTADFFRPGVDFVFNSPPIDATNSSGQVTTTPVTSPNVTFLNPYDGSVNASGNPDLPSGGTVLLEHAYISSHSRNNYSFGILNCVDVFINGSNPTQVSSTEIIPPAGQELQNSNAALWTYQVPGTTNNHTRQLDAVPSAVGSLVEPLYWQPVIALPDTISIGRNTYYLARYWNPSNSTYYWDAALTYKAHYIFVEETNLNYGTVRCRNGIEWFLSGNNYLNGALVTDTTSYTGDKIDSMIGTAYSLSYTYDQNVSDLQATMEKNKQITQDVLVHKTRVRYFQPIITIMYSFGTTPSVVNASINAALASYFENQYYGTAIQMSDILQVVHNVPGVDNVRWTNETGNKVQEVAKNGNSLSTPVYFTTDFYIQDSELADSPDNNQTVITVRTANTWN